MRGLAAQLTEWLAGRTAYNILEHEEKLSSRTGRLLGQSSWISTVHFLKRGSLSFWRNTPMLYVVQPEQVKVLASQDWKSSEM